MPSPAWNVQNAKCQSHSPSRLRLDPRTVIYARRQKRTRFTPALSLQVRHIDTRNFNSASERNKTSAKSNIQIIIHDNTRIIRYNAYQYYERTMTYFDLEMSKVLSKIFQAPYKDLHEWGMWGFLSKVVHRSGMVAPSKLLWRLRAWRFLQPDLKHLEAPVDPRFWKLDPLPPPHSRPAFDLTWASWTTWRYI